MWSFNRSSIQFNCRCDQTKTLAVGLTGFGYPQRRRRVFILASLHGDPRDVLLAPQPMCLGKCRGY